MVIFYDYRLWIAILYQNTDKDRILTLEQIVLVKQNLKHTFLIGREWSIWFQSVCWEIFWGRGGGGKNRSTGPLEVFSTESNAVNANEKAKQHIARKICCVEQMAFVQSSGPWSSSLSKNGYIFDLVCLKWISLWKRTSH